MTKAVAKRMQRDRLAQPRGFRGFLEQANSNQYRINNEFLSNQKL
jgi:hypothetical protein